MKLRNTLIRCVQRCTVGCTHVPTPDRSAVRMQVLFAGMFRTRTPTQHFYKAPSCLFSGITQLSLCQRRLTRTPHVTMHQHNLKKPDLARRARADLFGSF